MEGLPYYPECCCVSLTLCFLKLLSYGSEEKERNPEKPGIRMLEEGKSFLRKKIIKQKVKGGVRVG